MFRGRWWTSAFCWVPPLKTMPKLTTQKELRQAQKLGFCYLCGQGFEGSQDLRDRDHVPPESIFAKTDRSPPLILPVHVSCNRQQSGDDEAIGQLVAVLHGKYVRKERQRLELKTYRVEGLEEPIVGLVNPRIRSIMWRWIRGFHAALYGEYLPEGIQHIVHPPLWSFSEGGRELKVHAPRPQEPIFVKCIKMNRLTRAIDTITTCSDKCVYECTWDQFDNGRRFCVFALRLYDWEHLSVEGMPQRGCVGAYVPTDGMPKTGTRATRLEFGIGNRSVFDPFGS